jgi:hypothetical protein
LFEFKVWEKLGNSHHYYSTFPLKPSQKTVLLHSSTASSCSLPRQAVLQHHHRSASGCRGAHFLNRNPTQTDIGRHGPNISKHII